MSEVSGPSPAMKSIRAALIIAGVQLVGTLLLVLAKSRGMIDSEATTRGVMMLIGLSMAASGNRMPKTRDGAPPQTLAAAALRQSVLRVSGWTMTLGGLAYAGVWAFAPRDMAMVGSLLSVGGMAAILACYCLWRYFTCPRSREG